MNIKLVFNMLGKLLLMEACLFLPSMCTSLLKNDGCIWAYAYSILIIIAVAIPLILATRKYNNEMYTREGMTIAGLSWVLFSFFGGLPLVFAGQCGIIDAFFEITSGLTTTGATIFSDVESLPASIQFYRSSTHWVGGMGVLVLTTAVLPGISSRLARAESSGPSFSKLVPHVGDNSKALYLIYFAMTVLLTLILCICGMNPFEASMHAMSTAGTGGFSNKGLSIGAYNSVAIEVAIGIFMILFSFNFSIYFRLINKDFKSLTRNSELKVFLIICAVSTVLIGINISGMYGSLLTGIRHAFFQVSSIVSTTGFTSVNFDLWPGFSKTILTILMLIGGCAGSTAGGLKLIRIILLTKAGRREIVRSVMPRRVQVIKLDGKSVSEEMISQISVYFGIYIFAIIVGAASVALEGNDLVTSFSASLACISNVGPGFAKVGAIENFGFLSGANKLLLSVLMLAGRLEFYPLLILFCASVWRKT